MSIRREQALLLIVIALGAWYWTSLGAEALPKSVRHRKAEPEELQPVLSVLAAPNEGARPVIPGPDREPSESSPLPPRSLSRPPPPRPGLVSGRAREPPPGRRAG